MFLPAYDAAREPVSNGLRCVARLRLKLLAETLAIIAGILYVACAGSPSPRQGASEPRRCLPCRFSPHSFPRWRVGHALRKLEGSTARVFLRQPEICQEHERFEGGMPLLQGMSRVRALGCADVCGAGIAPSGLTRCDGITAPSRAPQERTGISSAGCPRSTGRLACARWGVRECTDPEAAPSGLTSRADIAVPSRKPHKEPRFEGGTPSVPRTSRAGARCRVRNVRFSPHAHRP